MDDDEFEELFDPDAHSSVSFAGCKPST